jgi:hypothetical protein
MTMNEKPITQFTFGDLQLSIRGLGVYFGGELLAAKCAALDLQQLRKANQDAWKQRKAATRAANRVCNVSVHGNGPYDRASLHENVAREVCRETWKQICQR